MRERKKKIQEEPVKWVASECILNKYYDDKTSR
jgi:hypothetical protein